MRIAQDPRLPVPGTLDYERRFNTRMYDLLREIAKQVNQLTEGQITAVTNAAPAAPTTGTYQQGDFIRNSTPTEQGSVSSKYVVIGWINVSTTGTASWKECRCLTGN